MIQNPGAEQALIKIEHEEAEARMKGKIFLAGNLCGQIHLQNRVAYGTWSHHK
jgi:hypothetical protein